MNLLLDTHTFLWWSLSPERLPQGLLEKLQDPGNRVVFSAVSSWEAQIKLSLGKLSLEEPLQTVVEREIAANLWEVLPISLAHTWLLRELPPLHRDPFDRLLVAQALREDLVIATRDPLVRLYPRVKTLWE